MAEQHSNTVNLLKNYIHIFTIDTSSIKAANIEQCQINLKSNAKEPKCNSPHRVSPAQRQELKIQLDKLMQTGIVKHTKFNFVSSVF